MSDLIYMKGKYAVNLDHTVAMSSADKSIIFRDTHGGFEEWQFDNEHQAAIVYQAILRSKCKNIGETEITTEELKEIGL